MVQASLGCKEDDIIARITEEDYLELCAHIAKLREELSLLPLGNLLVVKQGTRTKWYVDKDGRRTYLHKADIETAKTLAKKKFLKYELSELIAEKNAIERYFLAHSEEKCGKAPLLLNINSGLFLKGIAYRYECKMEGLLFDYYPDFTIRHPVTGEIWYWEHFGIMDSASYRETVRNKIKIHAEQGYFPGRNLICTYETLDDPFTPRKVEDTIKFYFGV